LKKSLILHPFLLTIYAILAPIAHNIGNIGLSAIRILITGLIVIIILLNVVNLFVKQRDKTGFLITGVVLGFFSYGHLDTLLSQKLAASLFLDILLLFILGLIFVLWAYFVLYRLPNTVTLSNYLNIVGLVVVIFPIYNILAFTRQTSELKDIASQYQQQALPLSGLDSLKPIKNPENQPRPDIYYIILDGYTRSDVLKELYNYDNTEFLSELEKRGFYIAKSSRANYTDTVYSIASSLNMMHINTLPEFVHQMGGISREEILKDILSVIIQNNQVSTFLHEQGYSVVSFDTSYDRINITSSDYYEHSPNIGRVNPQAAFELMFMDTTVGKIYFKLRGKGFTPIQSLFDDHREKVLYTFSNLAKYAQREGNYFIYAHVISPHSPYIFGPNGEVRRGVDPFTLLDQQVAESWSPSLYTDQVSYINKLVLVTIDQILENSNPKPIIILQADHSSRAYDEQEQNNELRMKLLLPILNAYYLHDTESSQLLYSSITPVNSFRMIFNHYFGTNLEVLEDNSYIMESKNGQLEFVNACETNQACSH
jgi:hypothetical protein